MPHLGESNGFPTDGVRAQPCKGLLSGVAERKPKAVSSLRLREMSSGSTDLKVKDLDPLPAMPEMAGNRQR